MGTIISVDARLGKLVKNEGVTVAPTATPNIVRIPSLRGLYPSNFAPNRAVSKQPNNGPNSHGNGRPRYRNEMAPVKATRWVNINLRVFTICL